MFSNKFKEINMAYEVLSDKDKKKEYDLMSKTEQYEFYDVLKNMIFKIDPNGTQIVNNVINFFYDDEDSLKSELNDLNFTNIFSRIQTKLENSTLIDISKFLKSMDTNKNNVDDTKEKNTTCLNFDVNPDIKLNINVSLKDKYTNKYKKITYKTNNEQDIVHVPLYGNEMIFPNKGNYFNNDKRGDLYITVNTQEHKDISIINENDLAVFIKISLYEYLYGTCFKYDLFGDEISINVPSCVDMVPIIKIDGKGLPYKKIDSDDEYVEIDSKNDTVKGDFYIYLQIQDIVEYKSQLKVIFPPLNRDGE